MKITNRFGLPETFLDFAKDGKYDKGTADISVTSLIDAPRVAVLRQQRSGDIVTDVSDMVWPLLGTAVHHMLESSTPKGNVTMEERLFTDISGWTVSGQIDHQEETNGLVYISDYKVTSVWSVIYGKEDWERQLNCYAHLVRRTKGKQVGGIRIVAVMRDWNRRDAMYKPDYPKSPVLPVEVRLWSAEEAQSYMEERVHLHQDAQMLWDTSEAVVECTDEERWTKQEKWAVVKTGAKRATKVFDNNSEAVAYALIQGNNYIVQHRPGERTRCEQYCSVSEFCTQWAMERVQKEAPEFFGEEK
jgi:hypothetical protein